MTIDFGTASRIIAMTALLLLPMSCGDQSRLPRRDRELLDAAAHGQTNIIISLIKNGANVNSKSIEGRRMTPLLWSVSQHHWMAAMVLIDNGANVNASDVSGISVFEYVAEGGEDAAECRAKILLHQQKTELDTPTIAPDLPRKMQR